MSLPKLMSYRRFVLSLVSTIMYWSYNWYLCSHFNIYGEKLIHRKSVKKKLQFCELDLVLYNGSLFINLHTFQFILCCVLIAQGGHNYTLLKSLVRACNTQCIIPVQVRCSDNGLCNCNCALRGDNFTQCAPHYYDMNPLNDC